MGRGGRGSLAVAGCLGEDALKELGRRQVVKAPGFDPGIRRFESFRPSQFFTPGTENGESGIVGRRA